MVPQQAWSGKIHSISYLKVFGCITYAHVPKESRNKLDDKNEKCIFVGYDEQYKTYRFFHPITKKIIVSRDVIFKENESWNGNAYTNVTSAATIPYDEKDKKDHEDQEDQPSDREGTPPQSSQGDHLENEVEHGESLNSQVSNN